VADPATALLHLFCLSAAPDTAPQDTAPQDTAPQDTAPQDTAPQETVMTTMPRECPDSTAARASPAWSRVKNVLDVGIELAVGD
jgi:hypothetical protein